MSATKGTEEINKEGSTEIKVDTVDTVDYRTNPGQEDNEPEKKDVHVVHLTKQGRDTGGHGGGLAGAAAAVSSGVQSAKEKIFGGDKDKNKE